MQRTDMTGVLDFAALHSGSHSGIVSSTVPLPSLNPASMSTMSDASEPADEIVASLAAAASEAINIKEALHHGDVAADISHAYTFSRLPGVCAESTAGHWYCAPEEKLGWSETTNTHVQTPFD